MVAFVAPAVANAALFSDDFDVEGLDPRWNVTRGAFTATGGVLLENSGLTFTEAQMFWEGGLTDSVDQFAKLQVVTAETHTWGFMFRTGDPTGNHYEVHLPVGGASWRWELNDPDFVERVDECVGDAPLQDGDWLGAAVVGSGVDAVVSVWRWDSDPDPGAPDPVANWGIPDCQMKLDPSLTVDTGRGVGIRSFTGPSTNPSASDNWSAGDLVGMIPPPPPPAIVRILSSAGTGASPMLDPDGIVVDSVDNVYVASCGVGSDGEGVFKVEPGGAVSIVLDSSGDGVSPANCPVGLAVDSMDNVYVAAFVSNNVFEITPGGVVTQVLDAAGDGVEPLDGPLGVAVDASDAVIVTGVFSDNVFALPSGGGVQRILDSAGGGTGTPLDAPFGVATDAAGNVFVAGFGAASDSVFKVEPGGATSIVLDASGDGGSNPLVAPHGVAVDMSGDLYVTGNISDNVFRVTPQGDVSVIADLSGDGAGNPMDNPTSVAVDAAGNVYVAAYDSDNAFAIPPGGTPIEIIDASGDGATPYGAPSDFVMALDSLGYIYTAGIEGDAVFRIAPLPEPGPLLPILLGGGLIAALGRRRR